MQILAVAAGGVPFASAYDPRNSATMFFKCPSTSWLFSFALPIMHVSLQDLDQDDEVRLLDIGSCNNALESELTAIERHQLCRGRKQ